MSKLRLGIISDCVHFQHPNGQFGTETHILLQQIEALAIYFQSVTLCCPVVAYDEKKVATYYSINNITIVAVPNVGGNSLQSKIKLLSVIPQWLDAFKKINIQSDIVYQRFPNNLNIPGFFYFWLRRKKTFATFTGTWKHYAGEPFTYRLQRWLLQHFFKGPVWVYADENFADSRIHAGFSPSYHESVFNEETELVEKKIQQLQHEKLTFLKMITVGAFVANKNQQLILDACLKLHQSNIPFQLTLVGDGVLKEQYQHFINQHQLNNQIKIAGKKTAFELRQLYREHDFVVQSPLQEGFGKVPVEGFFHGLIPVLSNTTMALAMAANGKRGFTFISNDVNSLYSTLANILDNTNLPEMIAEGRKYAASQTLEAWAKEYLETITMYYFA